MTGGAIMIYYDVEWLRGQSSKLCPKLRKRVLGWYRPSRYTPCFLNKSYTRLMKRWRKIPVIVQLSDDYISLVSTKTLAESAGCNIKSNLPLIHAFSTEVNEDNLKLLLHEKGIQKIWYDSEIRAVLDVGTPTVAADLPWDDGFTGKGITIAVLDTGVFQHADFTGRIKGFKDFIHGRNKAYDDNGHGTHVAGCAAAAGEKYSGPAKEAGIVGVKVLNKTGSGKLSTVILGIQWCMDHSKQFGIRIINLSLGSDAYQSYQDDPICQAVEGAWINGLLVCCAAGNTGPQAKTINSPGIHPLILTIGASNDRGTFDLTDDRIADFSSRGPTVDGFPKPDVVAPGVNIIATKSPGSYIDKQDKSARVGNHHLSLSGTSMATPICAGVAAQILQKNPALTPGEVKTLLMTKTMTLPQAGNNDQGSGMIRAADVINAVSG
jgi:serine protease AprX